MPVKLSIDTEIAEQAVVVHVEGDLDVFTAPRLKEALASALGGGGLVVLDLSQVHFVDSTALGVMAGALEEAKAAAGELRLVADDPFVLKVFHITGFDGLFSIFPRVAEAVSAD